MTAFQQDSNGEGFHFLLDFGGQAMLTTATSASQMVSDKWLLNSLMKVLGRDFL